MTKPYEQRFPWKLDWNLLRTFMVVVEQCSISRTADFLGLKQPTISSALKRLEQTTGQTLVVRKPNEFRVTQAGQRLYSECRAIFGTISHLPALLEAGQEELRGHIFIATVSHVTSPHFDEVLHRFATRHPKVTFSVTVADSEEVLTRVNQNRASVGICLMRNPPSKLKSAILYQEYFGLFCGHHHRLFNQETVTLADLEGEASVSFQTEVTHGPLEPVARLRGHARLATEWRGVSSNLFELRRMIIAGLGIGALPLHVASHDVERKQLRQLPPFDNLPQVPVYMIWNPDRRTNPAESAFMQECRKMLESCPLEMRTYI